ncbi:MAG: HAMP domain-containing histidine kinase [Rhodospirillales bacterium]|nr:HAMP domain-containing histidine kinase [Rhodospirillales bacterium]
MKTKLFAFFSVLGHPLYFYIWSDVFPQSYEEIFVRLIAMCGFVIWLFLDRKERSNNAFFVTYTYFALTFGLPFFFFYMFLQNDVSGIWLGSLICGIFYLALIVDPLRLFFMIFFGFIFAFAFFLFQGNQLTNMYDFYETIPVILFAVTGGIIFKYVEIKTIITNQNKAVALAGSIAHELRTPMMGMQLELEAFDDLSDEEGQGISLAEFDETFDLLKHHHSKASHVVDCLLQNVRDEEIDTSKFTSHSMKAIAEEVIRHYPLTINQQQLITIEASKDFDFWGEDFLMAHVVMNLIKNALTAVSAAEKGSIIIQLSPGTKYNLICVKDTGKGISPKYLNKVFNRFYTNTNGGAGLGLAFCERVVKSFNGQIDCHSVLGNFTEFTIRLPVVESS